MICVLNGSLAVLLGADENTSNATGLEAFAALIDARKIHRANEVVSRSRKLSGE